MAQNLKFSNGGFSARVSFSRDWQEYRVRFYRADGAYMGDAATYHTDDKTDAIDTAQVQLSHLAQTAAESENRTLAECL